MEITILNPNNIQKIKFLLLPLFEDIPFEESAPAEIAEMLMLRKQEGDFEGKHGQSLMVFPDFENYPSKVLMVGFGKAEKITAGEVRNNAALAVKSAKHHNKREIGLYLGSPLQEFSQELAEGLSLANYNPAKYQTGINKEKNEKKDIKKINFILTETERKKVKKITSELNKGFQIADSVNHVRDLVNGPHNVINADSLLEEVVKVGKMSNSTVTILDEKDMAKLGMGAMLGVSGAGEYEPKLVIMEYRAARATSKRPVVLVGKGITFDSGGYNLKPSAAMEAMKMDMAGAAGIIGAFALLKKMGIRRNVIGVLALTENLIGPTAQKVNDIVTAYNGKTIEVANTDAEGRLILADAVSYAAAKYKPDCLIDLATLTGAIISALGERHAGLFSNDKELSKQLRRAGNITDELVWPMPIHPDVREKIKGKLADYVNWEPSGFAGSAKGAAFIEAFVGKTRWAHIDIAGTAYSKEPKKYDHPGATGYGVRLLLKFLERA
jgi:leucyl aminopeptidase